MCAASEGLLLGHTAYDYASSFYETVDVCLRLFYDIFCINTDYYTTCSIRYISGVFLFNFLFLFLKEVRLFRGTDILMGLSVKLLDVVL